MIRIKNREYSGQVISTLDDMLVVTVHTADDFNEVAQSIVNVTEIIETDAEGNSTVYNVTAPISAGIVSQYVYMLKFSTKPTPAKIMQDKIQEQSEMIDALLVALLEG